MLDHKEFTTGITYYELHVPLGEYNVFIISSDKGFVTHYEVLDLPIGYTFDVESSTIKGILKKETSGYFEITACSSDYITATEYIRYRVEKICDNGDDIYLFYINSVEASSTSVNLTLKSDDIYMIKEYNGISLPYYSNTVCMKADIYTIKVNNIGMTTYYSYIIYVYGYPMIDYFTKDDFELKVNTSI